MKNTHIIRKALVLAFFAAGLPFASTSMLVLTSSPYSMAVGNCHDLLDRNVPLTRTYSSLYTLKDKTEFVFFHQILPNAGMIENAIIGLKNDWVKGMRFAAYGQYLSIGTFNNLNESGISYGSVTAYDLLVGVPVIFNPFSIPFGLRKIKEETNKTESTEDDENAENEEQGDMLETVLKASHAAINVNYFQSQLGTYTAWSLFFDVNLAGRFKFPYIGQPTPLISQDEIETLRMETLENEKQRINTMISNVNSDTTFVEEEKAAKIEALNERRNNAEQEINRKYARKRADVRRVHRTRRKIYAVITRDQIELEAPYVSNFVRDVIDEIYTLMDIASNAMFRNYESLTKATIEELENNKTALADYKEKLAGAVKNSTLASESEKLFARYDALIEEMFPYILDEEYTEAKEEAIARRHGYKIYYVQKDDTWKSIATAFYENEARYLAIVEYNNLSEEEPPKAGTPIKIPFPDFLRERKQKELVFTKERNESIKVIRKEKLSEVENLYFESTVALYDNRLELFRYLNQIEVNLDEKFYELQERVATLTKEVEEGRETLLRDLKKFKLKKELDFLNANRDADYIEARKDYKNNERAAFETLLTEIYKAKKKMIEDLKEEEEFKYNAHTLSIKNIYERKLTTLRDTFDVQRLELKSTGDNTTQTKELTANYNHTRAKLQAEMKEELTLAQERYENKIEDYDWELNITQLIYLSSEERKDTFAVGAYVKNLGLPVQYIEEKEYLPVSVGVDLNYMFLASERVNAYGYLHYGYSDITFHTLGIGGMVRMFDFVDVRAGTVFNIAESYFEPTFTFGSSVAFDLGLMNYRVDVGMRINAIYGTTMSIGLNIIF